MVEPIESDLYDESSYDDLLDEIYEKVTFGYLTFLPSEIIKQLDPITYRCGMADIQETVYQCPLCNAEYDNYEDAKYCCQEEYECEECGEFYETEEEAIECCNDND